MLKERSWFWVLCSVQLQSECLLGSCSSFLLWLDPEHCQGASPPIAPRIEQGETMAWPWPLMTTLWQAAPCLCLCCGTSPRNTETERERGKKGLWNHLRTSKFYTAPELWASVFVFCSNDSARVMPRHERCTSLTRCRPRLPAWSPERKRYRGISGIEGHRRTSRRISPQKGRDLPLSSIYCVIIHPL